MSDDQKLVRRIERAEGQHGMDLAFFCPACREAHAVSTREPGPVWKFNGNFEKPTIEPSIKLTGYRMSPEGYAMIERGEKVEPGQRYPGNDYCCHSVVTDGMIRFCGDCTHALVNQTVPLEPM